MPVSHPSIPRAPSPAVLQRTGRPSGGPVHAVRRADCPPDAVCRSRHRPAVHRIDCPPGCGQRSPADLSPLRERSGDPASRARAVNTLYPIATEAGACYAVQEGTPRAPECYGTESVLGRRSFGDTVACCLHPLCRSRPPCGSASRLTPPFGCPPLISPAGSKCWPARPTGLVRLESARRARICMAKK